MAKKAMNGSAPVRIVILQRGWVMVGRYHEDSDASHRLDQASVVRVWGTTRGLGEIAAGGPTPSTKLEPAPTVRFHPLTVIATIDAEETKWAPVLK